jgi:FixJ family two-component response regulator
MTPAFGNRSAVWFGRAGFRAALFPSAEAFLAARDTKDAKCLILDVRMPHMGGLELQAYLEKTAVGIPIIFATGYPDMAERNKALDHGAVAFLPKPFGDDALLAAMRFALGETGRFGVSVVPLSLPATRVIDV